MIGAAVLVFLGSGLGGVARWALGAFLPTEAVVDTTGPGLDGLPIPTILANVAGSALAGFLINLPPEALGQASRVFLVVGFAGGFTTLSAFNVQTFSLLQQGEPGAALANVFLTLIVSFVALVVGWELANQLY